MTGSPAGPWAEKPPQPRGFPASRSRGNRVRRAHSPGDGQSVPWPPVGPGGAQGRAQAATHPDSCPSWASLRRCRGRLRQSNQISLSGSSCFLV